MCGARDTSAEVRSRGALGGFNFGFHGQFDAVLRWKFTRKLKMAAGGAD
jgi:hypothetical protein